MDIESDEDMEPSGVEFEGVECLNGGEAPNKKRMTEICQLEWAVGRLLKCPAIQLQAAPDDLVEMVLAGSEAGRLENLGEGIWGIYSTGGLYIMTRCRPGSSTSTEISIEMLDILHRAGWRCVKVSLREWEITGAARKVAAKEKEKRRMFLNRLTLNIRRTFNTSKGQRRLDPILIRFFV